MFRLGFLFTVMIVTCLSVLSPTGYAQTTTPAPGTTRVVPPDLDAKFKKRVNDRAERRKAATEIWRMNRKKTADCKAQAKAQKLGFFERRAFVAKCRKA